MSYKRKRYPLEDYGMGRRGSQVYSNRAGLLAIARPYKKRRRTVVPGVTRVGGYYGRFSGAGGEMKFLDTTVDVVSVAASGEITDTINVIAQGVTESQRIGRKCTIRSIQWNYQMVLPARDALATPGNGDTLRAIIYLDKQCNGATATVTDILETATWQSFRNLANQGRFTILYDKQTNLNYLTLGSDGAAVISSCIMVRSYKFSKKCAIPIEFDSTTGALTEMRSNNIGVLLISSTGTCNLNSQFRLRYSDR